MKQIIDGRYEFDKMRLTWEMSSHQLFVKYLLYDGKNIVVDYSYKVK